MTPRAPAHPRLPQPLYSWIALLIEDATAAVVAGATVTSTPMGQVNYNASGLPSASATATATDGIAYDTNITAGNVTVKAAKAGITFMEHTIKVRPDVVTLTLVTPCDRRSPLGEIAGRFST